MEALTIDILKHRLCVRASAQSEKTVKPTKLPDGTAVSCLLSTEARVLDHHVNAYFSNGIELHDDATVVDVGADIGIFDVRTLQNQPSARVIACEPVPAIFKCLEDNAKRHGTRGPNCVRRPT